MTIPVDGGYYDFELLKKCRKPRVRVYTGDEYQKYGYVALGVGLVVCCMWVGGRKSGV